MSAARWTFAILLAALPLVASLTDAHHAATHTASETLVEGHTVFAVVRGFSAANGTNPTPTVPASVPNRIEGPAQGRFPGILWFNDQYLFGPVVGDADESGATNPTLRSGAALAALVLNDAGEVPCGGAVMVVNSGAPDPRLALARVAGVGVNPGGNAGETRALAEADVAGASPHVVLEGATTLADEVFAYEESYLLTDPNDRSWIVDRFSFYPRADVAKGELTKPGVGYAYTVWVVNIGGGAFVPDDGESCPDALGEPSRVARGALEPSGKDRTGGRDDLEVFCDPAVPDLGNPLVRIAADLADVTPLRVPDPAVMPVEDAPCAGYRSRSANGVCYSGPVAATCPPPRRYNAVVAIPTDALTHPLGTLSHTTPSANATGCASGTEWACPVNDERREGDSHGFRSGRIPVDVATCAGGGVNHGGVDCSRMHGTYGVDVYFSSNARPFTGSTPNFTWKLDAEGSGAPAGP